MTENHNRQFRFRTLIKCVALTVLFASCCFLSATITAQQAVQPVTVILVRHAEKEVVPPENKDPNLSSVGKERAQEIARMFENTGIVALYATQYKRTEQTVSPLSQLLRIPITRIEAKKTSDLVKQIRSRPAGDTVFVAGHNNTVPEIIAALGGPQFPIIPETEFDNLYILTIQHDGSTKLVKLRYGSHLPASEQQMTKP
ncbi:MAG TPA: phosphoglycerate mutase family protein [Pyrinomonadaceae bacterium]|nr:phosphoglycerate mutase family protein [Pyrinomonadaceae bacterium]